VIKDSLTLNYFYEVTMAAKKTSKANVSEDNLLHY